MASRPSDRHRGRRGGFADRRAIHLPLSQNEEWRCLRARDSAGVVARLSRYLREYRSDRARLGRTRFHVPFNADLRIAGVVIGIPQLVSCVLAIAAILFLRTSRAAKSKKSNVAASLARIS